MFSNAVNRTAGPRSTGAGGSPLGREPEVGVAYVEACRVERGRGGQPEPFEHVLVAGGGGVGQGPAQQLVPGNPAAVLGWADSFPADAAWVAGVRVGGGRRLHRHLVFPVVPEVVEVLQDGPGSCDLVKADAILRGRSRSVPGGPYRTSPMENWCRWPFCQPIAAWMTVCSSTRGQAAGTSTRRQMTGSALSTSSICSCSAGSPCAGPPWARRTAHRPSAVTGTMPARRSSRSRAGFTASSPLGEQLDGEPDVAMQAAPPPVQLLVGEILRTVKRRQRCPQVVGNRSGVNAFGSTSIAVSSASTPVTKSSYGIDLPHPEGHTAGPSSPSTSTMRASSSRGRSGSPARFLTATR